MSADMIPVWHILELVFKRLDRMWKLSTAQRRALGHALIFPRARLVKQADAVPGPPVASATAESAPGDGDLNVMEVEELGRDRGLGTDDLVIDRHVDESVSHDAWLVAYALVMWYSSMWQTAIVRGVQALVLLDHLVVLLSEWDSVAVICDSSCGETQMDGRAMLSRQCQSSNWVSSELLKRYQTAQRYRYHASDSFLRRRTMFAIMETVSRKNNQVMRWTPPWGRKATSVPVSAMTMATCRLNPLLDAQCPTLSVVGKARIFSPLLPTYMPPNRAGGGTGCWRPPSQGGNDEADRESLVYLGGIFRLCKLLPPVRLHGPILGSVVRAESWRGTNDNMITCAALRDGLPHAKPASLARQKGYTHPKIVCELNKTNRYLCSFEVGVTGTTCPAVPSVQSRPNDPCVHAMQMGKVMISPSVNGRDERGAVSSKKKRGRVYYTTSFDTLLHVHASKISPSPISRIPDTQPAFKFPIPFPWDRKDVGIPFRSAMSNGAVRCSAGRDTAAASPSLPPLPMLHKGHAAQETCELDGCTVCASLKASSRDREGAVWRWRQARALREQDVYATKSIPV
ncbi:predicted protein [Plenodomus lingam JN3]|uniref:Predicted protein n=1 Tax=Leptosphaeria maculans (strain JN3 / isolate v23.1.3 / race Av1-4-5-6-7-8) TaxID=985895 RepID=E4ZW50_LEPMJ|nr:predicted protein [Plenodomus lingam JN3]CBX95826.1 predicted protein [Plenodomus lingam JN3]